MAELAAVRAEVEAAAAAAELKALRTSSTGSSVSTDDDRDNEFKLAREATREQAAQWAAVLTSAAAAAQTGADVPAAGLTEIAAFTGGASPSPDRYHGHHGI
jgi:hypothetical protein